MTKRQALDRLKAAQIDIDRDPIVDIIDEIVAYADELGISDPFEFGDQMVSNLLDDAAALQN